MSLGGALFALVLLLLSVVSAESAGPASGARRDEYKTFGTVLLDSLTFPKIVPSERNWVLTMVSNKGGIGQQSTDGVRDAYLAAAESLAPFVSRDSILFTQVIVNGAQNRRLAGRIGCPEDFAYPKFFLFAPQSNASVPFSLEDSQTTSFVHVQRWIHRETGIYLGAAGTVDALDQIVDRFRSGDAAAREAALAEMRVAVAKLVKAPPASASASTDAVQQYLKTMEKAAADPAFAATEIARLEAILQSDKVSSARKQEFFERANVIKRFV